MIDFVYIGKVKPNAELKRCYDCAHLKGAVNTWCTNPEAVKARGTPFPGVFNCSYWDPMPHVKTLPILRRLMGGLMGFYIKTTLQEPPADGNTLEKLRAKSKAGI